MEGRQLHQPATAAAEAKTDAPKKRCAFMKDEAQASAKGAAARKQVVVDTSTDKDEGTDADHSVQATLFRNP